MEMTNKKVSSLIFNLIIILFFLNPFLLMLYTQFLGISIQEIITVSPKMNVLFITSFITPFIGYYMLQLKQRLEDDNKKIEGTVVYLIVIAISLLIMGTSTFAIFVSILVFYMFYQWKMSIQIIVNYFKKKKIVFREWIAPTAILIIAICIRFMLILVSNS